MGSASAGVALFNQHRPAGMQRPCPEAGRVELLGAFLEFAAVLVRLVDAVAGQCDVDRRGQQPDAADGVFLGVHPHPQVVPCGGVLTELASQQRLAGLGVEADLP